MTQRPICFRFRYHILPAPNLVSGPDHLGMTLRIACIQRAMGGEVLAGFCGSGRRDEAIFEVWDAFEAINPAYYYTTGIMWPIYAYLTDIEHRGEPSPLGIKYFAFMTEENRAYERRRARIENGVKERIERWYRIAN